MSLKHEETNGHRRVCLLENGVRACEELLQGDKVAKRLAHLLTIDRNHIVVYPVACRVLAESSLRLRNLALVVGEHKVHTATVNIELLTKILGAHRRALHMPTGEAIAPR